MNDTEHRENKRVDAEQMTNDPYFSEDPYDGGYDYHMKPPSLREQGFAWKTIFQIHMWRLYYKAKHAIMWRLSKKYRASLDEIPF